MNDPIPTERERTYLEAIRARVCRVCLDQRDDGSCGLTRRTCAIEAHLPRLAAALAGVDSRQMDAYDAVVRAEICPSCAQQDAEGRCATRDAGDCALLTYLPLVLDAIESVNEDRQ
ncbi:MAG: hypothetical protein ABW221_02880 [Vicinamibacteria bacterium]